MSSLLKNCYMCFIRRASLCVLRLITPNPPSVLEVHTMGQVAVAGFLDWRSEPLHKQCLLYLSICSITVCWSLNVQRVKVGRAGNTEFVSWSLPAWFKKEEAIIFFHIYWLVERSLPLLASAIPGAVPGMWRGDFFFLMFLQLYTCIWLLYIYI